MQSSISGLKMPEKVEYDKQICTDTYGRFVIEPLERGYGITLGNTLRRILLSSIKGAGVISVRIENAEHEFSTLSGIVEDVPEIIRNIKNLVVKLHSDELKTLTIDVKKAGQIKAAAIQCDDTVEVVNKDLLIATLTKNERFFAEIKVGKGRGFVLSDTTTSKVPLGTVLLDVSFSPIKKVNFIVENARVGQITDYDKLIFEITTNGSITPQDVLLQGVHILKKHLELFDNFVAYGEDVKEQDYTELISKLKAPISELELSVRSANCLIEADIKTIADLVTKTEAEMLTYKNFGKKSLAEINNVLKEMGLGLNMNLDEMGIDI